MKIIYQLEKICHNILIVFSTTDIHPNSCISAIQKEIETDFNGIIIFDLIISNNQSCFRFLKSIVKEGVIDKHSTNFIESRKLQREIIEYANNFYKTNTELVNIDQILSNKDKQRLMFK